MTPPTKPTSARELAETAFRAVIQYGYHYSIDSKPKAIETIESLILTHTAEVTKELQVAQAGYEEHIKEEIGKLINSRDALQAQLQSAREVIGEAKAVIKGQWSTKPWDGCPCIICKSLTHITEWQEKNK